MGIDGSGRLGAGASVNPNGGFIAGAFGNGRRGAAARGAAPVGKDIVANAGAHGSAATLEPALLNKNQQEPDIGGWGGNPTWKSFRFVRACERARRSETA